MSTLDVVAEILRVGGRRQMTALDPSNFEVISQDVHGDPVSCSFCTRRVPIVVVLPLTRRPALDDRITESEDEQLWLGLCAYCVLGMARALARNSNQSSNEAP